MKASDLKEWPGNMKPGEWPKGTLDHMDADLFTECVFPLRKKSKIPMSPSSLYGAHVRHDSSGSAHSTKNKTRLGYATDFHVSSIIRMLAIMSCAESIPAIGGIGIYFDTNTPLVHIDKRKGRLVWLCYPETVDGKTERVYLYRENNPALFYKKLGELL